ncbi:hypothetical protein B0T22DRAFT_434837 [Podospora appendiculata]|uniref:Monooxygenase n=1 Tax=Podospora appendiculata TaxID=314037 RepID=A0AAE0WYS4_9PEZI|nr:hypothetical protein B0T22DRAFT_434837 [Podospora appendiculata]
MKVAVIGAGPSGLVTLKYLLSSHSFLGAEPIEARLFESEGAIGGTFYARTYEDAELVSSKQLTTFSDFRPRDDDPDFLSARRYLEYLHEYCSHFNLWPHIHLSTPVQSVTRDHSGKHTVTYLDTTTGEQSSWECDAIAVCSGLHVTPNVPDIPGIENIPVRMHSSEFKTRAQFGVGKTVLVLGSGETGADVAYMAVTAPTKRVVMCHRNGFHFAPKRNLNPAILPILGGKANTKLTVPLDNSRGSLFDTAYVHPLLRNHTALWTFYDIYVKSILWTTTGTSGGLDQLVGTPSPEKNHVSKIFFNKSSKASAYISAPYRHLPHTPLNRLRRALIQNPIPDTRGRHIDLAPWPKTITPSGVVHFHATPSRLEWHRIKNETITPDMVIFCTGYRQEFSFFTAHNDTNGEKGRRYPLANEADVRAIWKRDDPSIAFIGFVRPSLGAIPPIAEMQAQLWLLHLLAPSRLPRPLESKDEPHYRLLPVPGRRVDYGVDHESYVYQLALDMDAAAGVREVCGLGGWRLPLAWALGANVNAKFRLRGPWAWEGAVGVLEGEVWGVVRRRRVFYDLFLLSILPMAIFGPLSMLVWIYATLRGFFFGVRRRESMSAGVPLLPSVKQAGSLSWVDGKVLL